LSVETLMIRSSAPSVSVVIPAFNRVATIFGAVESVLRQTFSDFELLVVDDGSSDDTLSALRTVGDARIRLLANPRNMGPGAARNTGIREARGQWIAFQDSDDEWMPTKLEEQMARIAALGETCVAAYCGMTIVGKPGAQGGNARVERYFPDSSVGQREGNLLEALLRTSLISTQTLIARRDALEALGGFDENLPALEDWDCALRLAPLGSIAFVDRPLVRQFFSENSITRNRQKWIVAREKVIAKHIDAMARRPALLAEHYRSIAGDKRRVGDNRGAQQAIAKALRATPFDPRLWVIAAYLTGQIALGRG
jgi:glycosyltransferase involved in cell wall biosynthesis